MRKFAPALVADSRQKPESMEFCLMFGEAAGPRASLMVPQERRLSRFPQLFG